MKAEIKAGTPQNQAKMPVGVFSCGIKLSVMSTFIAFLFAHNHLQDLELERAKFSSET